MPLHRRVLVHVDTAGKTDDEVAAEVAAQLAQAGITKATVNYERIAQRGHLEFTAIDHDGREFHIEWFHLGSVLNLNLVDNSREPGMTDAQLRAKIERQLGEDGVDLRKAVININGDDVQVLLS